MHKMGPTPYTHTRVGAVVTLRHDATVPIRRALFGSAGLALGERSRNRGNKERSITNVRGHTFGEKKVAVFQIRARVHYSPSDKCLVKFDLHRSLE